MFFCFRHFGRRFYCLFSYEFISFLEQNCFFNESVCSFGFRHFGRRFCGLFSFEFKAFFKQNCFFNDSGCFLASDILENGSGSFFHMNLYAFLKQMCFFNESVCFFGFRHFGRRFCGIFSYEFISFFQTELYYQGECLVFWLPAFCKTVLCPCI